ncbi:MAG TPA: phosphatidylserine decarboxylase family protein [Vicinamibacteria bacterium]|nr:phosphatidylserine decarboxylase family protein [Vicinamibacteria bacterium]
MTIAREGWPYIGGLLVAGAAFLALRLPWPGSALIVLGLFTAFFFRDPEREIPGGPGLIVSPADGKVVRVVRAPEDHPLGPGATQVSIFLSIFDVHINRAPIGGTIEKVEYHAGEFLPAFDDKASLRNEQNAVTVRDGETRVMFKQIAGLIARRIVFRKRESDAVARGERVGLIKFGSRVDVFLPGSFELVVKVGDRVAGGRSVLARRP